MKKLLFVIISCFLIGTLSAQEALTKDQIKKQKQEEKEAKKKAQEEEDMRTFQMIKQALVDQSFVLEAQRLSFKRGKVVYVNQNTNFISLNDGKAVVQLAFNTGLPGANGMGGLTVEGVASNITMKENKKGDISFSMNVTGNRVSAQVTILIPYGGTMVDGQVNSNFNSNRINYSGTILTYEDSQIFKGTVRP